MAVTLQVSGFNISGNAVRLQTVDDGSTIHIERLPDGSSFIYVVPPTERPRAVNGAGGGTKTVGGIQTGSRAASANLGDEDYFSRNAVHRRLASSGDLAFAVADQIAVLHRELRDAQTAVEHMSDGHKAEVITAAAKAGANAAQEAVRRALVGATIVVRAPQPQPEQPKVGV